MSAARRRSGAWSMAARTAALASVLAGGCTSARPKIEQFHRVDLPAHSDSPTLAPPLHEQLLNELRGGDIVLCTRDDPIGMMQRLTTVEPTYFLHSGTIEIIETSRGGQTRREVVVWHSTGVFDILRLSPHILGKIRGGVRCTPLDSFVRGYDALAIIRLDDPARNARMVEACHRMRRDHVGFDPYFDTSDRARLYCSEFTAAVIEEAGYDFDLAPAPRTGNRAMSDWMRGWNITTDALYMAGQFERLPGARTIAVLSVYGRMETYMAFRDAAALLHERVAAGQAQPGDFVNLDRSNLVHFSPRMQLFMRGVDGVSRAAPTSDPAEIRRRNEILYRTTIGAPAQ